jgi:hypothetical protein
MPKPLKIPTRLAGAASLFVLSLIAGAALAQSPAAEPSLPYTVKSSDKLIVLSKELLIRPSDWAEVAKFNQMKDPDFIKPGQKLNIPLRLMKTQPAPAQLISVSGDVQLGGKPVAVGTMLPDGALLQTGPNSSALMQLADGSRVTLLPGTLAEVVSQKGYAMRDASKSGSTTWFSGLVRLAQGSLETLANKAANRAAPLQIQTPTSLVGVRGTQFRVGYAGAGAAGASTEVLEGKVRADNPAQASGADLPGGTGAVVNPKEKVVKVVKLLDAPNITGLAAQVYKPLGTLALPALAALPGAKGYRVQVSPNDKFEQIVRDLQGSQSVDLGSLPLGNWAVRLRGIDGQGLEGFDAVKMIAVSPEQTWRVLSSFLSQRAGKTLLEWDGMQASGQAFAASPAPQYSAILLASEGDMKKVLLPPPASATPQLVLGDLKPGTYFIKLLAQSGNNPATETATYRFDLPGNWGATVFDLTSGLQPVAAQ